MSIDTGGLAVALADWKPTAVESSRHIDPWAAAAFADLLDTPRAPSLDPGSALPPLWHWFYLLDHPAQSTLGADGHPAAGGFLPPIPGRRRMFAGGRLRQHRPIPVGSDLACRSEVADVTIKTGRSGEMAFVTVRRALSVDGAEVAVEEQDIVYRSEPEGALVRRLGRPGTDAPPATSTWRSLQTTDPTLLFRFSALTYNAHRIHYDNAYATTVEGYPDLVVHGPLLALLALELPRLNAPERVVTEFAYRLVRPAFVPSDIESTALLDGDRLEMAVGTAGAAPSLTSTAALTPLR
jgi:3-methylfumaryl-CoA hydratase